jgi:1-acyl-sn-glycerol-3-phosphate acyltransferase
MPDLSHLVPRTLDRVLRVPNRIVLRTFFDLEVEGVENLPREGGVVIAANHFSHLDPPLITINLDRYIRFLALDELFEDSKMFGLLLEFFGTIPLDRDGYPISAMREAIRHITSGGVLGVFPEGRRVERWGEDEPKRGAAWLAKMTDAPLIPVAIVGTEHSLAPGERAFRRTAVKIWVEKPIWWADYEGSHDPLVSMMDDWYAAVNGRVQHWS